MSCIVMVIGFTQRRQTVSEGQVPGVDFFPLPIDIRSMIESEQEYTVLFRVQEGMSTATVEAISQQFSEDFDARFGNRQVDTDPIEDERLLVAGNLELNTAVTTFIENDFLAEEDECYTIAIQSPDVGGVRDIFDCNEDGSNATSFFCLHTICITNDDGTKHLFITQFISLFSL